MNNSDKSSQGYTLKINFFVALHNSHIGDKARNDREPLNYV